MATVLDLSNKGSRRLGMRRTDYHYAESLLENGPQSKEQIRNSTPDIFAPPQDSSDEASITAEDNVYPGNASSLGGVRRDGGESPRNSTLGKSTGLLPPASKRQSSMEASNIPATTFTSNKGRGNFNSSQSSPKRGKDDVEDDEEDMSGVWSQTKRPRTGYGGSSQRSTHDNIHHSSKSSQPKKSPKQANTSYSGDVKPGLRFLKGTDNAIARATRLEEQEKAEYKKPPLMESTPRASRAQARSSHNNQSSSQDCPKASFRVCKPLSSKQTTCGTRELPTYKLPPISAADKHPPRATRSNKARTETIASPESDEPLNGPIEPVHENIDPAGHVKEQFTLSNEVQDAADLAKQKLGLLTKSYKPPPSSTNASSLPSTSFDDASSNSPLSSPPPETPPISPTQKNIEYVKNATLGFDSDRVRRCPLCKERIDQNFLDNKSSGERLTIRQQAAFCRAHKKHAAKVVWEQRCFPHINWHQLDERLKCYHDAIDDILQGRRSSFYRNAFEDLVKNRKDRTLRKDLMNGNEIKEMSPGYYGSRGAGIMVENIMSRFASKLRRLAASDNLIASGDISGYVQAVLVPELAVLLVMDDMNVDDERARGILRDSIDIGNLLNEEEDELIKDPVGDTQNVGVHMTGITNV